MWEVLELSEESDERSTVLASVGELRKQGGKALQQAKTTLTAELMKRPDDKSVWYLRALVHFDLKQYHLAAFDVSQALQLGEDHAEAHFLQVCLSILAGLQIIISCRRQSTSPLAASCRRRRH